MANTRPTGDATRERILDAAERLFADHGFDGVSLRQITAAAGVQLALANYHFGSKAGLWTRVFERRARVLGEQRLALLAGRREHAAPAAPSLEAVIDAFIRPYLEISRSGDRGWSAYARLIAQTANSAGVQGTETIAPMFDHVAGEFLAALAQALPEHDEEQVVWSFHFMMGVMLHTFARTGRVDRLTDGRYRSDDVGRIVAHMIPFLAAGMRACRADGPASADEPFATPLPAGRMKETVS